MADKAKNQKAQDQGVSSDGPKNCKAESCKAKQEQFGFCKEHYALFMEGIIRADGKKPIDFEEKLARFKRNQSKVA